MAFPGVASYTSVQGANATNQWALNYPSNIQAGNLLICFGYFSSVDGLSTPSGWTVLSDPFVGDGSYQMVWYKVATGSESGTIQTSGSGIGTYFDYTNIVYRITGYSGAPQISSQSTGTSASPNSSGLTITGGEAKDVMWISFAATGSYRTFTSAPTDYTDNFVQSGNSGTPTVAVACRNVNAQTEDPSSFALSSSDTWYALTLAVLPDPAAASSPSPSVSPSASRSPSASASASLSPSASRSPSASLSPSASTSQSTSPSPSLSPSASRSPSASLSPSASMSPSASSSASMSPSASLSPSSSTSPSASPSRSQSPSASPSAPDWDEQTLHTSTFTKQSISFH